MEKSALPLNPKLMLMSTTFKIKLTSSRLRSLRKGPNFSPLLNSQLASPAKMMCGDDVHLKKIIPILEENKMPRSESTPYVISSSPAGRPVPNYSTTIILSPCQPRAEIGTSLRDEVLAKYKRETLMSK